MPDVFHWFGSDIAFDATGDLFLTQDEPLETQQAIVRRLMTAAQGYLWHPRYGAGLPERIGNPVVGIELQAVVQGQMLHEASVARSPAPRVLVSEIPSGAYIAIKYTDRISGKPVALSLSVPSSGNAVLTQ